MHVCKYIIICIYNYIISIYIYTQVSLQTLNLQQSSTFTIEASIIQSLNIQILKLQALHLEHLEMKRGSLTFFKVKFWSIKPWIPWMLSIEMPRNAGKSASFGSSSLVHKPFSHPSMHIFTRWFPLRDRNSACHPVGWHSALRFCRDQWRSPEFGGGSSWAISNGIWLMKTTHDQLPNVEEIPLIFFSG